MVKVFLNQIQSAAGLALFTTNSSGDPQYFAANTASRVVAVNSAGTAFELKDYSNWDTAYSWGNHASAGYLTTAVAATTYVPYTGASANVNLGEYGIAGGFFSFDTTPTTYTSAVGRLGWNDTNGTLEMLLKGGNVLHTVGETTFARVYNNTGSSISRGQVVYISGSSGTRLTVDLADADTEATSKNTLGFAAETIGINSEGFVMISGLISNINTSGYADGATIYLSSTAGGYTNTAPTHPAHTVILGFVVKGGSTGGGSIFVKVNNGYEIDELHNVLISSVQPNDVLYYDNATQLWKNASIVSKIAANTLSLSQLPQIATSSFLGRVTAGTGNVEVLTGTQATSLLDLFSTTTTTKGLVPGSNGVGTTYFLRADGTWAVPAGGGGGSGTVTSVDLSMPTGFTVSNNPVTTSGTLTVAFASGYSLPTNTSQTNWNTAYSWGNHASAGYQLALSGTGLVKSTSGTISYITDNSTNWNTAYGWGDHATQGYLTSIATNSITDSMLRQSAALSVIGRATNTSGNVADIVAGNDYEVLRRNGTSIGFGSIDLSQAQAVGTSRLQYSNLAQGAALSVLGVAGNLANDVASINAASDFHVLRRSGTSLGFGTLNAAAMNSTYTNGQYLMTDGSGNLSWGTPSGGGGGIGTVLSPSSITTWQNDYNPIGWGSSVQTIRLDGNNSFNFLTGLSATVGGHRVKLINIGSNPIGLYDSNTSSTAANRFDFGNRDIVILPKRSVTLEYDGTSTRWRAAESVNIWSEVGEWVTYDKAEIWNRGTSNWSFPHLGYFTGATDADVGNSGIRPRAGVATITTGSFTSGSFGFFSNHTQRRSNTFHDGTNYVNYHFFESAVRVNQLSDGTNRFVINIGWIDQTTGAPTNGVYAFYSDNVNGGNWTLRATDGSVDTDGTNTNNVAVVANDWYRVRIVVYPNATASMWVNGTFITTVSTGIPGSGKHFSPHVLIRKTLGSTACTFNLDYVGTGIIFNSAR